MAILILQTTSRGTGGWCLKLTRTTNRSASAGWARVVLEDDFDIVRHVLCIHDQGSLHEIGGARGDGLDRVAFRKIADCGDVQIVDQRYTESTVAVHGSRTVCRIGKPKDHTQVRAERSWLSSSINHDNSPCDMCPRWSRDFRKRIEIDGLESDHDFLWEGPRINL